MSPRPTLDTVLRSPACVADIPRAILVELLAEAAAVQSTIVARLVAVGGNCVEVPTPGVPESEGKMMTVAEAAALLRKQPRWVYRHAKQLPFVKRLSPKALLVSEAGLRKWIEQRRV
jgi:helix-turn-helix protein